MLFYRHQVIYQALTGDLSGLVAQTTDLSSEAEVVRRVPVFQSVTVAAPEEIAGIETGWYQAEEVIRRPRVYQSSVVGGLLEEVVVEEVNLLEVPPVVRRSLTFLGEWVAVPEEIPTIENGWNQSPPPLVVLRVPTFLGDLVVATEEVAEIGSGWWADPPPPVLRPRVALLVSDASGAVLFVPIVVLPFAPRRLVMN